MQKAILTNGCLIWVIERGVIGLKDNTELAKGKAARRCIGIWHGCLLVALLFFISGCGIQNNSQEDNMQRKESVGQDTGTGQETKETTGNEEKKAASSGKILIAYFTLADNYENPIDMDATSQASINIENKERIGNTEYLAGAIQEETGGDLFSVVVKNPYPNDYDKITDMGSEEQEEDARPELAGHVENMAQYDTVFIGFPIWWYTMPQAMFTFLEEYDFTGKTVIPFTTHGGYGVGSSVEDIQKLCPGADVVEDIFEADREDIGKQIKEIGSWIEELGIRKSKK